MMWELFLRLLMLKTFVHELAHHEDHMRRVARGRWRADNTGKTELYAEAMAAQWVEQCVVPYLQETYPDAVRDLTFWTKHHGGTTIPLALLAGDWRWNAKGKTVSVFFGSAREAFLELVRDVQQGRERTSTQLRFAEELHYGENYAEALEIINCVLAEQPANLEALTLQADIFCHKGEYMRAETLARQVVDRGESCVDGWMVLADVYEARQDWTALRAAASKGITSTDSIDWRATALLKHRARANLELQEYASLASDLEVLFKRPGGVLVAAPLRALGLLRRGEYEEALRVSQERIREKRLRSCAVLAAVRFEAAQQLARPEQGGRLTVTLLNRLRRLNYYTWADQLVAKYGLARG